MCGYGQGQGQGQEHSGHGNAVRDRSLEGATGRRQTAPVPHLLAPRPRAGEVFVGLDLGPLVVHQVTRATHRRLTRRLVLLVTFAGTETKIRFRYRSGTRAKTCNCRRAGRCGIRTRTLVTLQSHDSRAQKMGLKPENTPIGQLHVSHSGVETP